MLADPEVRASIDLYRRALLTSPGFASSRRKGSSPARTDLAPEDLDIAAKVGLAERSRQVLDGLPLDLPGSTGPRFWFQMLDILDGRAASAREAGLALRDPTKQFE